MAELGRKKMSGGVRIAAAMVLYAGLLAAALATLSDWRIRLVTVAVVLLCAGRTLWAPRKAAPSPFSREADGGGTQEGPM
ncbi:MAG: hypothetical protein ACRD1C_13070 [Terriglobales bacterium]